MRVFREIFVQTFRTLWAHKLRSFLTMFGIAWGVGSLLLLVGVGEGFRTGNRKQLATFGQDIMFLFPGRVPAVEGQNQGMRQYYLTFKDFEDIRREAKLVKNVSPVIAREDDNPLVVHTRRKRLLDRCHTTGNLFQTAQALGWFCQFALPSFSFSESGGSFSGGP